MKRILKTTAFAFVLAVSAAQGSAVCPEKVIYTDATGTRKSCTLREDSFNNYCFYDCKAVDQ